MNRTLSRQLALLALPLLALLFLVRLQKQEPAYTVRFSEKINLALRRTAHHLLAQAGDSTSAIAPAKELGNRSWVIRLAHPFDYHALPALLQASLDMHGVTAGYDVALLGCASGELLLGYNKLDFTEKNGHPCGSREQNGPCYDLKITLAPENRSGILAMWIAGLFTALLLGYFYVQKKRKNNALQSSAPSATPALITIGASLFDPANQSLTVAGVRQALTYREAKLLYLFCRYPNQLLERDFILQSVWADEGILVGRSVDMFVSRLRKLLRDDPAVKLSNVRGVGYRLECGDCFSKKPTV